MTLRFVIDDENSKLIVKRKLKFFAVIIYFFSILQKKAPYEIFIRELVASDGTDSNQITLIDSNGCPTDVSILGSINKRMIKRNEDKGTKGSRNRGEDDRKGGGSLDTDLENGNNTRRSVVDKFKSAKLAATANEYEFTLNTKQLETSFEGKRFSLALFYY